MRDAYQQQLKRLHQELEAMGSSCEQIIDLAAQALSQYTPQLKAQTEEIGAQIDESEHTIETDCLKLLLRQQPVAGDLRQISAAMKMITDLERIGDQAEDIVELIPHMAQPPRDCQPILEMAQAAKTMAAQAVQACIQQDLALARQVMAADDVVDGYFSVVKKEIITRIAADPENGGQALDLLMIAKYFERIGDHCTNVAEWVAFSLTGVHEACQ